MRRCINSNRIVLENIKKLAGKIRNSIECNATR